MMTMLSHPNDVLPEDALPDDAPMRLAETDGPALLESPVRAIPGDDDRSLEDGIALCLSGGGYRAMLFHLGTLWRLNDLGLMRGLRRISSVSGGSITAATLGMYWKTLTFNEKDIATNFEAEVVARVRGLADRTVDVQAGISGILLPGSIADYVASAYRRYLFGQATLQDLPDDNDIDPAPRFVLNATNVQSNVLWRFSRPYMGDYRVGRIENPTTQLAVAVGASSAFPPFLSPVVLDLEPTDFKPASGTDLQVLPYTDRAVLTDGGVYDNLGLETAWKRYKTILISDAGGKVGPQPDPKGDWARHTFRVVELIDNQVRSLRVRQVMDSFRRGAANGGRDGAFWSVRSDIARYPAADVLPCPYDKTRLLAETPTRLKRLEPEWQEKLINWGYAACDAALRSNYRPDLPAPEGFPYPDAGI